jgi:GDPmannose 4,6-dehydratase
MWLMLQQERPDDCVLATGEAHSVRAFAELAFAEAGFALEWRGEGNAELGIERGSGRTLVAVDPRYYRPTEVAHLLGDASKAERLLGWKPKVRFRELVAEMVAADRKALER